MKERIGRRNAIWTIGAAGVGLLTKCDDASPTSAGGVTTTSAPASNPSCILTPSQTEGPFYFDAGLVRRDITEGQPGVPLQLGLTIVDGSTCSAIRDAVADIWHCDADGQYSGYPSEGTSGQRFLRGIQMTDASGTVTFDTIYPGWYPGRTVHIHVKIHLDERTVLTSQLYFPEEITDEVHSRAPYASRGSRTTQNTTDGIFNANTLLAVVPSGAGYLATLTIGVSS